MEGLLVRVALAQRLSEPIQQTLLEMDPLDQACGDFVDELLLKKSLLTGASGLGASVVDVFSLVSLGTQCAAAVTAPENSGEGKRVALSPSRSVPFRERLLDKVKQLLGDDRRIPSPPAGDS